MAFDETGNRRYLEFRPGDELHVVGTLHDGRLHATSVFGAPPEDYTATLRNSLWPLGVGLVTSVALLAVSLVLACVFARIALWRGFPAEKARAWRRGAPWVGIVPDEQDPRRSPTWRTLRVHPAKTLPGGTLLEELAREVFALQSNMVVMRRELTDLRQQLATVVRTRRLVVVDADGREGVTAEAVHQGGEVTAWCVTEEDEPSSAVLFATADEQENAGVLLSGGGNIHGTFKVRRIGDLPNGIPSYGAQLDVHQSTGEAGMVLDSDGLRLEPMRLYSEKQAWIKDQKERGRIPEDFDPYST